MALVVGLDLSERRINGAVFDGTARKFRLVDYFSEALPSMEDTRVELSLGGDGAVVDSEFEAPESPEDVLRRIVRERGLERAEFVACVSAADCGIREFGVPFTKDEQIDRTVSFEAEAHFRGFDIEDVILQWVRVGENAGQSQLVVVAARKKRIETRLDLLKQAEIDPISLDLDAAAVVNAFRLSPYSDDERGVLLVDLSPGNVKIVLLESGRVKRIRALRTSLGVFDPSRMIAEPVAVGAGVAARAGVDDALGETLDARLEEIEKALRKIEPVTSEDFDLDGEAGALDLPIAIVSDEEYERLSPDDEVIAAVADEGPAPSAGARELAPDVDPESGTRDEEPVDEAVAYREFLERIGVEVQRTLVTTPMERPLDLVCLTGALSRREEARRFFQEGLDVEAVDLEFGDALSTDLDADRLRDAASEGAVAVGLGVKALGRDLLSVDFRRGPFRYQHRLERLRMPLLNCAALLFLVFLQTTYWSWQRYQREEAYALSYEREAASAFEIFFEKKLVANRNPVTAATAKRKTWESGGAGDVGRFVDYVDAFKDFGSTLASTKLFVTTSDMKFNLRLKRSIGKRGGGPTWVSAGDSKVNLVVEQSDANILIEKAFRTRSRMFSATTTSRKEGEGKWKVSVTLTPKDSYLKGIN